MRRVVVTGLGMVSPLADGVEATWRRLLKGERGIGPITYFDATDYSTKIAGQVPQCETLTKAQGLFNPDLYLSPKEQRKIDRFIELGIAAAIQAVEDADWMPESEEERERTGVLIGSGIGGLPEITVTSQMLEKTGPRRIRTPVLSL